MSVRLYSYWRSSAAYRVRIALNLKDIDYELVAVNLAEGEHKADVYRETNPQGLVPFLEDGSVSIAQSMAILEYLEEAYSQRPLLPHGNPQRQQVRALCNLIACDVHPLNNLRVLKYLSGDLDASDQQRKAWYTHWIHQAFDAVETELESHADDGPYCFGSDVTLADCVLVPQVYNARRFDVPLYDYRRIVTIVDACNHLEAFIAASPDNQPDAPPGL